MLLRRKFQNLDPATRYFQIGMAFKLVGLPVGDVHMCLLPTSKVNLAASLGGAVKVP